MVNRSLRANLISLGDLFAIKISTPGIAERNKALIVDSNKDISGIRNLNVENLNVGGSLLTASAAEINYVDTTPGLAEAGKALVLDINKDMTGINSLSSTYLTGSILTSYQPNITTIGTLNTLSITGNLNLINHNGSNTGLRLNGTLVTATASELNTLDGITASVSELNVLDGITATVNELNYVDTTVGTGAANKALILDSSRNIMNINNLTASNITGTILTNSQTNITSVGTLTSLTSNGNVNIASHDGISTGLNLNGTLITASASDINYLKNINPGTVTATKVLAVDADKNITGFNDISLNGSLSTVELYLNNVLVQSTSEEINYLYNITKGTADINKAIVLDNNKDISGINNIEVNNLTISGTNLKLPSGNTASRPSVPVLGHIRYNSETSQFEGYGAGNTWGSLGGVINVEQTTKILAENSPGSNDNNLRFINNNTENMRITSSGLVGIGTNNPLYKLHISGTLNATGQITFPNVTDASSSSSGGCLTISGGTSIAKKLFVGTDLNVTGITTLNSSLSLTGSATLSNTLSASGVVTFSNTTDSSSVSSGGSLTISGGTSIAKKLFVGSSLHVGTVSDTTKILSLLNNTIIDNSNIYLSLGQSNTNRNQLEFKFHYEASNSNSNYGSIGLHSINDMLTLSANGNIGIYNITPNKTLDITGTLNTTGVVTFTNTTDATSISSGGSLTISGGTSIAKKLYIGSDLIVNNNTTLSGSLSATGTILFSNATDATSSSSGGALTIVGGASIAKKLYIGSDLSVSGNSNITGTLYSVGATTINNTLLVTGTVSFNNETDATSSLIGGAITIGGGAAIAKKLYVGSNLYVGGNTTLTGILNINNSTTIDNTLSITGATTLSNITDATSSSSGGCLTISGGTSIAKKLYIGSDLIVTGNIILNGTTITSSATKLNYLDILSIGTAEASKALILDSNRDIINIRNLSATNLTGTLQTVSQPNITTLAGVTSIGLNNSTTLTGTLQTTSQPNITSVGTLSSLTLAGSISGITTLNSSGIITNTNSTTSTSNILGALVLSGGIAISNITDATSVTNGGTFTTAGGMAIAKKLFIGTDLSVAGNSTLTGTLSVTGNITGTLVTASQPNITTLSGVTSIGSNSSTTLTGTLQTASQPNITSVGTLSSLSTGNITLNGTLLTATAAELNYNDITTIGTAQASKALIIDSNRDIINIRNLTATNLTGTIVTASQPNITSVGTLTSLSLAGSISGITTLNSSGIITNTNSTSSTSNILGALVLSGGVSISNITDATSVTNGGTFTTAGGMAIAKKLFIGTDLSVAGNSTVTGTLSVTGNITGTLATASQPNITTLAGVTSIGLNNSTALTGTLQTASQPNITSVGTLSSLSTGNITLNGTLLTATAVELNYNDITTIGTAQASKALIVDSNRDVTNIRNLTATSLSGTIATTSQPNITSVGTLSSLSTNALTLNGTLLTATATDINKLASITDGIASANKALVVDINNDLSGLRNLSISGNLTISGSTTTINSTQINLTDNIIHLNSGPSGSYDSGLLIHRYQTSNDTNIGDIVNETNKESYTASSVTTNSIVLPGSANVNNNYYNGWWIKINSATLGTNQVRQISSYNGTSKTITLASNFTTIPTGTIVVNLYNKTFSNIIWQETNKRFITGYAAQDTLAGTLTILDYSDFATNNLNIFSTTDSVSSSNGGSLTIAGGAAIAKKLYIGTDLLVSGNISGTILTTSQPNITTLSGITSIGLNSSTALTGTLQTASQPNITTLAGVTTVGLNNSTALTGTLQTASQPNITTLAGVTSVGLNNSTTLTGTLQTVSQPNITTLAGVTSIGLNNSTTLTGTLQTASQPNITSIGTLTGLTLAGSVSGITTLNSSGIITNTNTTSSTSNILGALVLSGGIAISNITDATSVSNGGTFTTAGGMAIAKKLFIGTDLSVSGNSTLTGTLSVTGNITGTLATASQPNITTLSGVTSIGSNSSTTLIGTLQTASQPNITSVGTLSSLSTGNITLNGTLLTATAAELNYNDITTIGTAEASKALIVDSNRDIQSIRRLHTANISIGTLDYTNTNRMIAAIDSTITNGVNKYFCMGKAYSSFNSAEWGYFHISDGSTSNRQEFGFFGANGIFAITAGRKVGINNTNPGYDLDVTGSLNSTSLYLNGTLISATAAELNYNDITTIGTAQASKTLIVDSNRDIINIRNLTATSLSATNLTGTLQTASQPNITSIGTLTSLTLAGALSGITTLNSSGIITNTNTTSSTSNILGALVLSGGIAISNITDAISATNGGTFTTAGGMAIAKKLFIGTDLSVTGNSTMTGTLSVTGNITGTLATASQPNITTLAGVTSIGSNSSTTLTGTLQTPSQTNITSVGTLTSLSTNSLTLNGTLISATAAELNYNDITTIGTAQASKALIVDSNRDVANIRNLTATSLSGTIATASQPNITSLGTLTSLTLAGSISGITTLNSSGIITNTNTTSSTSNILGALVLSGGIAISNITDATSATNGGTFTTAGGMAIAKKLFIGTDLSVTGNSTLTGTLSVTGNITGTLATASQPNITTLAGVTSLGLNSSTTLTGTLQTASQPNITSIGTLSSLSTSNITLNGTLISATAAELNYNDITTIGTAEASKALILDSNRDIANIRNLTVTNNLNSNNLIQCTRTTSGSTFNSINGTSGCTLYHFNNGEAYFGTTTDHNLVFQANNIARMIINSSTGGITGISALTATALTGTLQTASQPNITTLAGVTSIGSNSSTTLTGTLQTASQPNITSVGTLTGLTSSGQISITNNTSSTNATTGALIVTGGIGSSENINAARIIKTGLGNTSYAAIGTSGAYFQSGTSTITDSGAVLNGTVASAVFNSFGRPTLAATNTGVTTTNASTVYIDNEPLNGTNMTFSNAYALWVNSGKVLLGSGFGSSGRSLATLTINANTLRSGTEGASHGILISAGNTIANPCLYMGADNTNSVSYIQSSKAGVNLPLILNNRGGFVGINMNSPGYPLDITGDINISGNYRSAGSIVSFAAISGVTDGTATASKALILDSSKNIISINNIASTSLCLGTQTAAISTRFISALDSAQTTTTYRYITFGQSNTDRNAVDFGFLYNGISDNTNAFSIGFPTVGQRFVIQANGNVGINNTSPGYALDITGDINVSGNYRSAGSIVSFSSISGVTAGIASASKALILDTNSNISGINKIMFNTASSTRQVSSTGDYRCIDTNAITFNNAVTLANSTDSTHQVSNFIGRHTITATNSNVTTTNFSTFYIHGEPITSTNMTITNRFALYINSGNNYLSGNVNIAAHNGSSTGLQLNGTLVTATAAELNILDGVTATAAELNILDGVTANAAELNYLDITTAGIAQASKALVVDSSSNINNIASIGLTTSVYITNANTSYRILPHSDSTVYLQAGLTTSSDSAADLFIGNYNVTTTASSRKIMIKSDGKVGFGLVNPGYTVDILGDLNVSGNYRSAGSIVSFSAISGVTAGTASASKALVLDSSSNIAGINNLSLNGALTVGTVGTGPNRINFSGTNGDANNDHTVLAERVYNDTEQAELIVFKGNDPAGGSGPDRIRMRSAEFRFQTYTSSESYASLADNNNRMIIANDGKVGINTTTPGYQLDVNGTFSHVPPGTILMYVVSSAPTGFLLCNGSEQSRTTYSNLFAIIGTIYGSGNGSTTFNVPDLRSRVPVGLGQGSGLTNRSLNDRSGAETHQLTVNEMPSHNHSVNDPGHSHSTDRQSVGYSASYNGSAEALRGNVSRENGNVNWSTNNSGSNISINNNGGNNSHNNMQPFIVVNFIIKF